MKIEWTGRGTSMSERLRGRIASNLEKLERYLRGHTEAQVTLNVEGSSEGTPRQGADVVLRNRLGTFTATAETHDMGESVGQVLEKLETQVRRARQKLTDSRRRPDRTQEEIARIDEADRRGFAGGGGERRG